MLTIRFRRVGKKNKAYFKLILQDKQKAPTKRHIRILGSYDPHLKKAVLEEERIKYWLGQGAEASDTAYNLLVAQGIISGQKRAVKIPAKAIAEAAPAENKKEDKKGSEKSEKVVVEEKEEVEKVEAQEIKG